MELIFFLFLYSVRHGGSTNSTPSEPNSNGAFVRNNEADISTKNSPVLSSAEKSPSSNGEHSNQQYSSNSIMQEDCTESVALKNENFVLAKNSNDQYSNRKQAMPINQYTVAANGFPNQNQINLAMVAPIPYQPIHASTAENTVTHLLQPQDVPQYVHYGSTFESAQSQ